MTFIWKIIISKFSIFQESSIASFPHLINVLKLYFIWHNLMSYMIMLYSTLLLVFSRVSNKYLQSQLNGGAVYLGFLFWGIPPIMAERHSGRKHAGHDSDQENEKGKYQYLAFYVASEFSLWDSATHIHSRLFAELILLWKTLPLHIPKGISHQYLRCLLS